ncbi:hypothetical protein K7432_001292 [Basidiobolus ranarum]|uniref:Uncharacterized protein n=1 Tax=Basidiobolus ranarum TaxID=34480 RepID=A0ABR2W9Y6_9FUNG
MIPDSEPPITIPTIMLTRAISEGEINDNERSSLNDRHLRIFDRLDGCLFTTFGDEESYISLADGLHFYPKTVNTVHDKTSPLPDVSRSMRHAEDAGHLQRTNDKSLRERSSKIREWTRQKYVLFIANLLLFLVNLGQLLFSFVTLGQAYFGGGLLWSAHRDILIICMVGSIWGFITSVYGFYGILRHERRILTIYCIALWPLMGLTAGVGYVAFRRNRWNLRNKLGHLWKDMRVSQRASIQTNLRCCGFLSAMNGQANTKQCYSRALLPGCFSKLYQYSRNTLPIIYLTSLAVVFPLSLVVALIAILCSNHISNDTRSDPPFTLFPHHEEN